MRLSWRREGSAPAHLIACLRLDLDGLLKGGYVREERPGHIRLRFVHNLNGSVCIQAHDRGPALVIGATP